MIILVDDKQKTGVYKIRNVINNKFYIGSTTGLLKSRCVTHRSKLRHKKHKNPHLQNAWNKYGENNFEFSLIENCGINEIFNREQYYIDTLKPEYNILQNAGTVLGYKHTQKTKEKISKLQTGKLHWNYIGEYVFYNKDFGYHINDINGFVNQYKNITKDAIYRLCRKVLYQHKKWICLGKYTNNFVYPNNIDELYKLTINCNRPYYAFYNKTYGKFIGPVNEFTKKFNLKVDDIKGIYTNSRQSAQGWVCFGKCEIDYKWPKDLDEIYFKKMDLNNKVKYKGKEIHEFKKDTIQTTSSINELCKKYNLNKSCVIRLCNRKRKTYNGWICIK